MGEDKNTTPLKGVLKDIVGKLDQGSGGHQLAAAWRETVSAEIAATTRLSSFAKGRLVIEVSDSSRLYELNLKKHELIHALNARVMGQQGHQDEKEPIKEIRLKIGAL